MNYSAIYDRLVERARSRVLVGYQEAHHVVPKCLGGSDERHNLVNLTPEEHFVAHQLLVKIHPSNHRLVFALKVMTVSIKGRRPNNKLAGWMRRKFVESMRAAMKGRKMTPSVMAALHAANAGKSLSEEHRAKLSAALKGRPKAKGQGARTGAKLRGRPGTRRGAKASPKTIAKMRAALIGRRPSAEELRKVREFHAKLTPEERRARTLKAWETRRRNQIAA